MIAFGLFLIVAAPLLTLAIPRSNEVAVFAGDLSSAIELAARAGGLVVRTSALGGVVVVKSASDDAGFINRLYHEGAWLVFDPIFLGGCARLSPLDPLIGEK